MRVASLRSPALVAAVVLLLGNAARAQKLPWQTTDEAGSKAPATVRFLGPEQVSIPARKPQELELHFRVNDGFHINSHAPHAKTLIPTQLMVVDGAGVNVTGVDFPAGTDYSFSFAPDQKVSVYTGDVVLHAHLTAQPGDHLLQGMLRYQACDSNSCMPPKKIPVAISILAK